MGNTPAKERGEEGGGGVGRNLRKSRSQEVNGLSKSISRTGNEFSSLAEKENDAEAEAGISKHPPTRKTSGAPTKVVGSQKPGSISKKAWNSTDSASSTSAAGSVRTGHRNSSTSSSKRESMPRKSVGEKGENPPKRNDSSKLFYKDHQELSQSDRDMISFCLDNAKHGDLGVRIYLRVFEKRPDLNGMFEMLGKELWVEQGKQFTGFLMRVVKKLDYLEVVENLCREFGAKHVDLRTYGFKPDFWVTMADAMTTECLYLDEGVHPPADVIASWGALISLLLGHMRDGYYDRLRKERKLSKKLTRQSTTKSVTSVEALAEDSSPTLETATSRSEGMGIRTSSRTECEGETSFGRGIVVARGEEKESGPVNQLIPAEKDAQPSPSKPIHFFIQNQETPQNPAFRNASIADIL